MFQKPGVKLFAKMEWQQIGGSLKARAAFNIISDAFKTGQLGNGRELLDASSGNTGIAYASIARSLGVSITICIPANSRDSIKHALRALGVNLIETSKFDSTDGAREKAAELASDFPELYFYADQFSNPANWKAHYYGTAQEIFLQSKRSVTHFVCSLGTCGTFTGTARGLKAIDPSIKAIALQPAEMSHPIEGWKHMSSCMIPKNFDPGLADSEIEIETWEAYAVMRQASEEEGLLLSPSAAANLAGAIHVARELESGVVVTVFPDSIERYQDLIPQVF